MTTLLITGARGQLGTYLVAAAASAGVETVPVGSAELDITDPAAVEVAVSKFSGAVSRPVIVNAAAYTAVDQAETDSERAYQVNATGPGYLAEAAARHGAGLIQLSTDYAFAGVSADGAPRPYEVDDPVGPQSVYGASKLAGEQAVLAALPTAHVVRTAWLYGSAGTNFVKTITRLAAVRPTVSVVDDQWGTPTWSADLAGGLIELARSDRPGGVLHATNGGETSWFGFARAIFAELGLEPDRVRPISSDAYAAERQATGPNRPRTAPRPSYSVLSQQSWIDSGLSPLRPWRDALAAAISADRSAYLPSG